jgi:hypothetical protein
MDSTDIIFSNYDSFIKNYDLFAFDFDLTVLKVHAYANGITASEVEAMSWKKLSDHFADPIFFRDLINHLVSLKKKVAIISFGTYNVIKAYLDRLFDNQDIFGQHNIMTPLCGNQRYNRNIRQLQDKNEMLIELARNWEIKYSRILFFDDDLNNIKRAKELGVIGVNIEKCGFNRTLWKELVTKASNNASKASNTSNNSNNKKTYKKKRNNDETDDQILYPLSEKHRRDQEKVETFENIEDSDKNSNPNQKTKSKPIITITDSQLQSGGDKKIVDNNTTGDESNQEGGFMSYYINWLNMFAAVFIAVYWIIKKLE